MALRILITISIIKIQHKHIKVILVLGIDKDQFSKNQQIYLKLTEVVSPLEDVYHTRLIIC
jgi:hypothetical protein